MADAAVSNTAEGNLVWVRIPPSLPAFATTHPPPISARASPIGTAMYADGTIRAIVAKWGLTDAVELLKYGVPPQPPPRLGTVPD